MYARQLSRKILIEEKNVVDFLAIVWFSNKLYMFQIMQNSSSLKLFSYY